MNLARFSPQIDLVETFDGVRYLLRTSDNEPSNIALGFGFILRIPLMAAGVAGWFLWQHFRQASLVLTGLAGLFVAQMLFAARLPWNLFRQSLWQQLIARYGHGEIELRNELLISGNRLGSLWSGERRVVREFQRIVVYVYHETLAATESERAFDGMPTTGETPSRPPVAQDEFNIDGLSSTEVLPDEPTADAQPRLDPTERVVLAIETTSPKPWLLVDGLPRSESIALAEDLHRRIAAVIKHHATQSPLPLPVVVETNESALYPPLDPDFYQRRKPWWLAIHLAGVVGLSALTTIAAQVGAWQISSTKVAILFGWIMETLIVGTTLTLSRRSAKGPTADA